MISIGGKTGKTRNREKEAEVEGTKTGCYNKEKCKVNNYG